MNCLYAHPSNRDLTNLIYWHSNYYWLDWKGSLMKEKPVRSIAKAISWRIVATLTTTLLVFAFTGNLVISTGVGASEFLLKIVIYYFHERLWNLLQFGKAQS
jgi:uncharacterized membrane protein